MSEIKKRHFQPFLVPLNRQASEKVNRFLSSYKNSRYTDADDSTGTNAWYAVYAKRAMETSESDERKDSAEVRFDIATENAWTALADIERYIFDK